MTERPIIFSAEQVRAILDGRKTQTRRVVKLRGYTIDERDDGRPWPYYMAWSDGDEGSPWMPCPYGSPGGHLWARETWAFDPDWDGPGVVHYRATHPKGAHVQGARWRPSIYMPRWASRITLVVTDVRCERLLDITEEDAMAEGVEPTPVQTPRDVFWDLWDAINAKRGPVSANPWVWAVSFEVAERRVG